MAQPQNLRRRGYTRQQLIAWLNVQARNEEQHVEAANEILTEFDLLYNPPGEPDLEQFLQFGQFVQIYDQVE